jgi:hypothetical protein
MQTLSRVLIVAVALVIGGGTAAWAQGTASTDEGWQFTVYPVLAWVPTSIDIDVEVPPFNGSGGTSGEILDSQLDGAFFGGVTASNGVWRVEAMGMWASVAGQRPDRPLLDVDVDIIYGQGTVGRRIAPDLFVNVGVRRLALDYDVTIGTLPQFSRKPGLWDPLVGIGWHRIGQTVEWHATFEGGGFGVGADVDLGAGVRVDWKPVRHFGFTAGYNLLYLKVSDEVRNRTIEITPTIHGPAVGIGLYF